MTLLNLNYLNGLSYNASQAGELQQVGSGVTISGNTYTVTPDSFGALALLDNFSGTLANPQPGDIVKVTLSTGYSNPGAAYGVVGYQDTYGDGTVTPPIGVLGAEIVGWNSTGILLEQLSGFVPNGKSTITPDGYYFIVGTQDISTTDGLPTNASFTFTQNGQSLPLSAIPEPTSALLMPVVLIGLMLARMPAVRSFLGAR